MVSLRITDECSVPEMRIRSILLINIVNDLSALVGCRSSVSIRRIICNFLNVCPFDYTAVAVSGKVECS